MVQGGCPPLLAAADKEENESAVDLLLEAGADANASQEVRCSLFSFHLR